MVSYFKLDWLEPIVVIERTTDPKTMPPLDSA